MRTSLVTFLTLAALSGCGGRLPVYDGGVVTRHDAGHPVDGGTEAELDAGSMQPERDAGSEQPFDAGTTGDEDAGSTPTCQCTSAQYCLAGFCVNDQSPPTVTLSLMRGDAGVIRATGTASDAETGIARLTLQLDDAGVVTVPVQNGAYAAELSIAGASHSNFVVKAHAVDRGNNVADAQAAITVDVVAPALTISPSVDGQCTATGCTGTVLNLENPTLSFTATATDDLALASAHAVQYRVTLDGVALVPWTDVSGGAGSWTAPTSPGELYLLEVKATDAEGNATTRSVQVFVDTVAPVLSITAPTPAQLVGTATLPVGATVTDALGISSVQYRAAGGAWAMATMSAGAYVGQLDVPVVDAVAQTLELRATDFAGNDSATTRTWVADRVAPRVTIAGTDADCSGAACTGLVANASTGSVSFTGTAVDGEAVSQLSITRRLVQVSDQSLVLNQTSAGVAGATTWSTTWPSLPSVNGAMYELQVTASDAAGNTSAPSVRRLWVDTVAPTATMLVNGQRLVSRTAALVGFSETMNAASVSVNTDPNASGALQVSADGRSFSYGANGLRPYTGYTLVLNAGATDKAGNPVASVPGGENFLTELAPLAPNTVVLSGQTFTSPRIVIDLDERPIVMAAAGATTSVATYEGQSFSTAQLTAPGRLLSRPSQLQISGSSLAPNMRRTNDLTALIPTFGTAGSSLEYATSVAGGAWNTMSLGVLRSMTSASDLSATDIAPIMRRLSGVIGAPSSVLFVDSTMNNMSEVTLWTAWSAPTSGAIGAKTTHQNGLASVDATNLLVGPNVSVRYWPENSVVKTGIYDTASAPAPLSHLQRGGLYTEVFDTAGYVAYGNKTSPGMAVACTNLASTPRAWREATVAAGTLTSGLSTLLNASTLYVAGVFDGALKVYSFPQDTTCSTAPVGTLVGTLPGVTEGTMTLSPSGVVWVAGVTSNGSVIVSHF